MLNKQTVVFQIVLIKSNEFPSSALATNYPTAMVTSGRNCKSSLIPHSFSTNN